jgi:membrane protein DedA with SNARE-associated domain
MIAWIERTMESFGYAGIVVLMFLENVFPPIPSELIMPLAGFTAARGDLSFAGVIVAGTLGSVLGALPFYYLGRFVGEARLRRLADRYGRWLTVSGKDIERATGWFIRHGSITVFVGRLVPGVRSLISIPAGLVGMNLIPFLLYTTFGAALWVTALTSAGWLLGANYERVESYVGPVSYLVLGGLAVAALVWLLQRLRRGSVGRG